MILLAWKSVVSMAIGSCCGSPPLVCDFRGCSGPGERKECQLAAVCILLESPRHITDRALQL